MPIANMFSKKKKTNKPKAEKKTEKPEVPTPPETTQPIQEQKIDLNQLTLVHKQLMQNIAEVEGTKFMANMRANRQLYLLDEELNVLLAEMRKQYTNEQLEELKTKALEELENRKNLTL